MQIPKKNCNYCPRLNNFITIQKDKYPQWHNAPVQSFGPITAKYLIVGLAPGLQGANRTGRPFTGDYAGDILYKSLLDHNLLSGKYDVNGQDNLISHNIRITNTVRCVPPQNTPTNQEQKSCRYFLIEEINHMPNLTAILTLGLIAHKNIIQVFNLKNKNYIFKHGKHHAINNKITLINSYHCSKYNIYTKRLTQKQFDVIIADIKKY